MSCKTCGSIFTPKRTTARYCRPACRQKADRVRRSKKIQKQSARRAREAAKRERRAAAEALALRNGKPPEILVADVHTWRPEGVDVIITDPPYITEDALDLYSALADFAVDVLPDGGALIVMTDVVRYPDVAQVMRRAELLYRGTVCWTFDGNVRSRDFKRRTFSCWKPVLVYHKGTFTEAEWMLLGVKSFSSNVGDLHKWEQDVDGFRTLVTRSSAPGDTVCDPFLGSGTTGVAALAELRNFIGADVDASAVRIARKRLGPSATGLVDDSRSHG